MTTTDRQRWDSHRVKVLARLKQKGRSGELNVILCSPSIGSMGYCVRIYELRRMGYRIMMQRLSDGLARYTLVRK